MSDKIRPFDNGGYFPIHNYVFDVCMPQLSNAGWRILCVAIRKTWGWTEDGGPMGRKEWDQISYSQFQEASGLKSAASVSKGLQECIEHNYLLRRQVGHTTGIGSPVYSYALNVNYEIATTESVAGNREHKMPATESVAASEGPASVFELGPASVFEDTKRKERQPKDEKKICGSFLKAWDAVLLELSMQMTRATYDAWLSGSHVIAADNGTWTVQLANQAAVEWVDNRLRPVIERTMTRHAPGVALEFVS